VSRDELEAIIQEQGEIEMGCQFCNEQYRFDTIDIAALFAGGGAPDTGGQTH